MTTTIEVTEVDGLSTSVAGPDIEYVRTDAGDVPNRVTSVKTSELTVCIGQMGIFADRQYGCPGWNRGTRVAREGCGRGDSVRHPACRGNPSSSRQVPRLP